jgi:hypothetical protein
MGTQFPDKLFGKPIKGSLEGFLANEEGKELEKSQNIQIPSGINPRDYIQVPEHNIVIALAETHKSEDMYETLESLSKEGFKMPSIDEFMFHWNNVREAARGKTRLLYADGTSVKKDIAEDLWKYMSSGHRGGCWTWLNGLFLEDNGWHIETELEVKTDTSGKRYLKGKRELLEAPVREDCYVNLDFNAQGMPVSKSSSQVYEQGKNIHFYHPRNGRVARFCAGSDGAYFGCVRIPGSADSSLGVFACAAKKLGGEK